MISHMRLIVLGALAATMLAAAGASARDTLIRPGVAIAQARLGMTPAQLRNAMGRPQAVIVENKAFGRRHLEYQYAYGGYTVHLVGPKRRERVISVTTYLQKERTPAGAGPGISEPDLLRLQRGVQCDPHIVVTHPANGWTYMGGGRTCTLGNRDGAHTNFTLAGPNLRIRGPEPAVTREEFLQQWQREASVKTVWVLTPAYRWCHTTADGGFEPGCRSGP